MLDPFFWDLGVWRSVVGFLVLHVGWAFPLLVLFTICMVFFCFRNGFREGTTPKPRRKVAAPASSTVAAKWHVNKTVSVYFGLVCLYQWYMLCVPLSPLHPLTLALSPFSLFTWLLNKRVIQTEVNAFFEGQQRQCTRAFTRSRLTQIFHKWVDCSVVLPDDHTPSQQPRLRGQLSARWMTEGPPHEARAQRRRHRRATTSRKFLQK